MFYEIHITVDEKMIDGKEVKHRWEEFCRGIGIKPLIIELSEGNYPVQHTCAFTFRGTADGVIRRIDGIQRIFHREGYRILRTKLECPLKDAGKLTAVPAYFECHVKLDIKPKYGSFLPTVFRHAGAYASRSLIAKPNDIERWWLTARQYGGTAKEARERFERILGQVKPYLPVKGMDMEAVVYDTFPDIDKGWIV